VFLRAELTSCRCCPSEAQNAEIRRIESDITQAKQMVCCRPCVNLRQWLCLLPKMGAILGGGGGLFLQVNSMQLEVRTMAEPMRSNLGSIIRTYQTSLSESMHAGVIGVLVDDLLSFSFGA
jgi:hypothetical protein